MDPALSAGEQTPKFEMETSNITCQDDSQDTSNTKKAMFTLFWDAQGMTVEYYVERGSTVKSAR